MSREPFTDDDRSPTAGLVACAVDMLVLHLPALMSHPGKAAQMVRLYNALEAHRFDHGFPEPPTLGEWATNSNEDLA